MRYEDAHKETVELLEWYPYTAGQNQSPGISRRDAELVNALTMILRSIQGTKWYEVLNIYYFQDNTLEQTAEIMNLSVSTVQRYKKQIVNRITRTIYPVTQYE